MTIQEAKRKAEELEAEYDNAIRDVDKARHRATLAYKRLLHSQTTLLQLTEAKAGGGQ
jgi:hypothetical protein